jgi:Family of unknown function (DUF6090)
MRLRSLTKHIKDQNWFAVALDFFIVVAGILIAFQITNWSEARGERHREAQILRDIATDLQGDVFSYSKVLNYSLDKISALNHILETTDGLPASSLADDYRDGGRVYSEYLEDSDELRACGFAERLELIKGQLWSRAVSVVNARPSTTAFVSLENSGELGLLQNKNLVRQLQEYRQQTAGLLRTQDVTLKPARDRMSETGHLYGLSLFGEVDEAALIELVSTSPSLTAVLQTQLGYGKVHFTNLSAANELAELLLKQIKDELGENAIADTPRSATP